MTPEIDIPKQDPHEGMIQIGTWQGIKWYEPDEAHELLKNNLFAKVIID